MEYKDFEDALSRLEVIVSQLEKGDLSLEQALQLFEEGVNISRFCNGKLVEAERKVEILLKNKEGRLVEEPFEAKGD
jgi:exodeoxyribonuclease VII small subunit